MNEIFALLSLVMILATLLAAVLRYFKQSSLIAYLLTGVLIPVFLGSVHIPEDALEAFSQMGVAFLLFIVGLKLDLRVFQRMGYQVMVIGILQMVLTTIVTGLLMYVLGWSFLAALLWGLALSFSSTVIVVKLLSDSGDLEKLHGQLSVGILLVQDVVAILVLLMLSYMSPASASVNLFYLIGEWIIIVFLLWVVGVFLLPSVVKYMAKSRDLLFIFTIAWCFTLSTIFDVAGLGLEVGSLIAGLSLSTSLYHLEISARVKPLRDFFIIMFFVSLGLLLSVEDVFSNWGLVIVLTLLAMVGKFLITYVFGLIMNYRKRVAFLSALSLSQISEFSFILFGVGLSAGVLTSHDVSLLTAVGILTIGISSFLISRSHHLYLLIMGKPMVTSKRSRKVPDIVLFGYDRVGYDLLKSFKDLNFSYEVIDYDPDIVAKLKREGINVIYGDATDLDFLNELDLPRSKLVISTIPDLEVNLLILKEVQKAKRKRPVFIATAHKIDDALELYSRGSDYVILPHFLGGKHVSSLIKTHGVSLRKFLKERVEHLKELEERKRLGHEHPTIDYKV